MKKCVKIMLQTTILIAICCVCFSAEVNAVKKVKSIAFKKYENTLTINKGESVTLKVSITPKKASNKKLKWTSSKKKVVSVTSKGVIKGKKKGKATITAATTDGSNKKIKLKVTVGVKVDQLMFQNGEELTELKVGSSYTLKAAVLPSNASNKKLKWSTSDSNIATVSTSGKVTGVSNGMVTITAESTDGTKKKIKKTFQIVTYVKSVKLSLKSSSAYQTALNNDGVFVRKGNDFQIDTEILPDNATDKTLVWSSSNNDVAIVSSSGKVTAVGCGVAVITAQAVDAGKKKDTFMVYVGRINKESCKFIAHRGRSEEAPENSMAAIRLALQSRFDSVEFDIWKTIDNEFVVSHDESLKNSCGIDIKVTEMTLAQTTGYKIVNGENISLYPNEYIPSLNQILTMAKDYPDKTLCIELKQAMSEDILIKLLETIQYYELQERVKLITFYKSNIVTIRSLTDLEGDSIAMEYLSSVPDDAAIQTCLDYNTSLGAKYSGLTEAQVKKLHENDIEVNVWNIPNFFAAYHMIHTMDIDAVTSNYQFFE